MSIQNPEIARVDELLNRLDFAAWQRVSEGLSHSQPYLRDHRRNALLDAQAWLAGHAHSTATPISAAMVNVKRVLDDLLLAFELDLDPRQDVWWMRKFYHRGLGGTGGPQEVERFELNVLLVQNLNAELARALNLLLERARQVDATFRPADGLATIDTGAPSGPVQAPRYRPSEAASLQPYPGLRVFPAVIGSRDLGTLGTRPSGDARTPADFETWIEELITRTQGTPSPPPADPAATVPSGWPGRLAEVTPRGGAKPADRSDEHGLPPSLIVAVFSLLVNAASVVLAPPWLAGCVIGATVGTGLAYLVRRPRPPYLRLGLFLSTGLLLGLVVGSSIGRPTTTLADAVDQQISEARRDDRFVLQRRSAPLHDGRTSVLMVLRDELLRSRLGVEAPSRRSDELRIVDSGSGNNGDSRLSLRYGLQDPGQIGQQPEGDSPGMLLSIAATADVDADGRREVLVSVERNSLATGPLSVPVVVLWDPGARRYRVHALTPQSPLGAGRPPRRRPDLLAAFRRPTTLEDQFSGDTLRGYPVDEFALEGAPRGPLFMAAVNFPTSEGASYTYLVSGSYISFDAGDIDVQPCQRSVRVTAGSPATLRERMRRVLMASDGPCG